MSLTDMGPKPISSATTQAPREDQSRWVWHNPLTVADLLGGMRGHNFTAMCGKVCNPSHGTFRHVSQLRPIERCQVCADLVAGGQRIKP